MAKRVDNAELEFFRQLQLLIGNPPPTTKRKELVRKVCGVDAAYSTEDNRVVATAALFSSSSHLLEASCYDGTFTFPYVSGLFYLHEGPFAVAAVKKLKEIPDLVCFDAHGLAHPNSRGLATICGMVLGIPSIGVAKSSIVGRELYRNGFGVIESDGKIGYVTYKPKRYWSPGFSVRMTELEAIISTELRGVCLNTLRQAHTRSKEEMKNRV